MTRGNRSWHAIRVFLCLLTIAALGTTANPQPPVQTAQAKPDDGIATPAPPLVVPGPFQVVHRQFRDPRSPHYLSFSADGGLLASSNTANEVRVFDLASDEEPWLWTYPELLETSLGTLVWPWCPVAVDALGEPRRWRLTGKPLQPMGWPGPAGAVFAPRGDGLAIAHNPCFSNSHVIVKVGESVTIKEGVWLLGGYLHYFTGPELEIKRTLETETPEWLPLSVSILEGLAEVTALAFSPNGELVVTGSSDGVLELWRPATGDQLGRVRVTMEADDARAIRALAFSPNGQVLAGIGDSGIVRLWSAASLALLTELHGHGPDGFWVEFSPDGTRLASAGWDRTLRVWEVPTCELEGTVDWGREVGDSPVFRYGTDRRYVLFGATRRGRGVIGAVDLDRGQVSSAFQVDLRNISAFARSPRGELLAAADQEGRVLTWLMRPGLLAAQ